MTIKVEVDDQEAEFTLDELDEEFSWHNLRDSNHCRRVRRKMFEALLAIARTGSTS